MRRSAVLVVTLIAALLHVGAGAGQSAARSGDTPSQNDTTAPRLTQFQIVDHNIEHKPAALKRVLERARTVKAEAITIQEICWWQARDLRRRHLEWTISWKQDKQSGWCLRHSTGAFTLGERERQNGVGNVAIWTGGRRGHAYALAFRAQRRGERRGIACVEWTRGARQRVCSVHLISPATRDQAQIRTKQAREVHRITATWIKRDDLVVLGGDFNSQPKRATLDYLYELRGRGHFREITPSRGDEGDCRCTQVTADGGRTKIDYVFFSANRMSKYADRSLRITPTQSDHHMLNGWAMVDATAH